MNIRDRKALKQAAVQHLQSAAYDPRKLALLHRGAIVALSLLISILSLALADGIASTGGLSGIGTRNILQTAQFVLELGQLILVPFWQIGILFAFMCIVRNRYAGPNHLLRGFQRFFPALRLMLLQMTIFMIICFAAAYISSFVTLLFSPELMEQLEPIAMELMQNPNMDPTPMIEQLSQETLMSMAIPMLIIFAVLYGIIAGFLSLEMRFANYFILDDPKMGAIMATICSFRLNHRNFWAMIRLDISFWFYYALQGLALGISMLQLVIPGLNLPLPEQVTGLLIYVVYGVIVLAVDWCMRPKVEATYALAYDLLRAEKFPTETA